MSNLSSLVAAFREKYDANLHAIAHGLTHADEIAGPEFVAPTRIAHHLVTTLQTMDAKEPQAINHIITTDYDGTAIYSNADEAIAWLQKDYLKPLAGMMHTLRSHDGDLTQPQKEFLSAYDTLTGLTVEWQKGELRAIDQAMKQEVHAKYRAFLEKHSAENHEWQSKKTATQAITAQTPATTVTAVKKHHSLATPEQMAVHQAEIEKANSHVQESKKMPADELFARSLPGISNRLLAKYVSQIAEINIRLRNPHEVPEFAKSLSSILAHFRCFEPIDISIDSLREQAQSAVGKGFGEALLAQLETDLPGWNAQLEQQKAASADITR